MTTQRETLISFLNAYNQRDIDTCASFMADDVELRSAYLMHQFPESGGVVRGKKELIDYLNWLFHEFEETVSSHYELDQRNDYLIVRAISDTGALRYYLHYYFNNDNLICLIKSNLTRTKNY